MPNNQLPSHTVLIKRFIDETLLISRLSKFSNIKKYYERIINTCDKKPPYYCHYMKWRLGTWTDEQPFEVFNKLLGICSTFPNWGSSKKNGQLSSCAFGEYWSLLWELQMAYFFFKSGGEVSWLETGPDFKVKYNNQEFYVECTILRKSFEIESFMGDIFNKLGNDIHINHTYFIPFALPNNKDTNGFLDEIFRPYLNNDYLDKKREEAKIRYPVLLEVPVGINNIAIYLKGDNINAYVSGIVQNAAGDPEIYIAAMLREVINNKRTSNSLKKNRPNLLAINFLLSAEFQMASGRQLDLGKSMPSIDLGDSLDAILYSACGITDEVTIPMVFTAEDSHIIRNFPHRLV